jgi:hypothetical protein
MISKSAAGAVTAETAIDGCEERALRELLEGVVRTSFGSNSTLTSITRSRARSATSFGAYVVAVRLAAGGELRFFLKDFGTAQPLKQELEVRRNRERRMYRDLLRDAGLGTPRYYDSVWDDERGRFWLLLEFVPGDRLQRQKMDYWLEAAAWLAKFHRRFWKHDRGLLEFLIRHDAPFFWSKAERALQEISQLASASVGKLENLLVDYDRIVDRLTSTPTTLLHGSFRSYNIMVEKVVRPARICPVDWESAALGTPLFDLAYLAHKLLPSDVNQLLAAYRDAALLAGIPLPGIDELSRQLGCVRLYMIVDKLGRARAKGYSAETVAAKLSKADELKAEILR